MNLSKIPITIATLGILIFGILVVLEIISVPGDKNILQRTPLRPGTSEWNRWLRRTATWSMYFYNTTNPDQVILGEKPKLREFGPYVYEVTEKKIKANYNAVNETVSYAVSTNIRFLPLQSAGSEEDTFLIPNIPLLTVARLGGHLFLRDMAGETLRSHSNETFFMTMAVAEILHRGKHSPVLKTFSETFGVSSNTSDFNFKMDMLRLDGFYQRRNATSEVKTGNEHSLDDMGQITRAIGNERLLWHGACGEINGTDGTIFPPHVNKDREYFVYHPHFLRSVHFRYVGQTTVEGVSGLRFDLPAEVMEYPGKSHENLCFCKLSEELELLRDPMDGVNCPHDGTISYPTHARVDTVISLPHFLHGSPKLHTIVEGMKPDPQRHQSYLELEPQSGLILSSHQRIQVNLDLLNPSQLNLSQVSNFSEILYPLLWFDRHITDLDDPAVKMALQDVEETLADSIFGRSKWLLCVAALVAVAGSVLWIATERKFKPTQGQNDALLLPHRFSVADESLNLTGVDFYTKEE